MRPLSRFLEAQQEVYDKALEEIKAGRKQSHWMWFIFPQFKGLGQSSTAHFYAIDCKEEAEAYLTHPLLGARLREISKALLNHKHKNALQIFGTPDYLKLKSSMTLFSFVDDSTEQFFAKVLEQFFNGEMDQRTIALMKVDD